MNSERLNKVLRDWQEYPDNVTSCILIVDGEEYYREHESCHGFLEEEEERSEVESIITACWISDFRFVKEAKRYYEYICSDDAPWANVNKELIYPRNDKTQLPVGIEVEPCNYQLMMSFLVATRTPWERTNKLRGFQRFLDCGFDGAEALYLCTHLWWGGKTWRKALDHPHTPLDAYQTLSLKKLRNKTPNMYPQVTMGKFNGGLMDNHYNDTMSSYIPLTFIWDQDPDLNHAKRYQYDNENSNFFKHVMNLEEYAGHFKAAFQASNSTMAFPDQGVYQEDEGLISIIKETQCEWDDSYESRPQTMLDVSSVEIPF